MVCEIAVCPVARLRNALPGPLEVGVPATTVAPRDARNNQANSAALAARRPSSRAITEIGRGMVTYLISTT